MADGDRVRIEVGFEGGQVIGAFVDAASADQLERALHEDGPHDRPADRGRPSTWSCRASRTSSASRAAASASAAPDGVGARGRDRGAAQGLGQVAAVRGAHRDARRAARSGWPRSADPRLQKLAEVVAARKVTPAAIPRAEVRGTGPALLGNLRSGRHAARRHRQLSGTRVPADDLGR